MGFLSDHCARVRQELADHPLDTTKLRERAELRLPAADFIGALRSAGTTAVIAEVKRASPSAGTIRDADPAVQAASYAAGGADAVSVLTEPLHFGGSILDLEAVRGAVTLPIMRKDFIVHPDQLIEARAAGADAALLIATVLRADELAGLLAAADALGMATLVEAFADEDLARAIESGAGAIGVNARDLESLEVDEPRALALLAQIPEDRVRVFESGIRTRTQVEAAVAAGAHAVLVGTVLMQADDPVAKLRELRGEVT